ncbi:MAG: ABC transporter substrate-binding protein [Chloroflexota bacterium]|nr:MAG: ABC transporter substrate-binding protein [Chloroflexota bacterium]
MRDIFTSRREVLRMIGLSGAAALVACAPITPPTPTVAPTATATPEDKTLRIGYLPITDAAPLLLAHARALYAAEGVDAARPTLLRSWAQVAEAFQAKQVDVVHILMPTAIWMKFGQGFPAKVVAWDHTDGSALTVANGIASVEDLAGKTVAVPFWYSIHNLVLQLLLKKAGLKPILNGDPAKADGTVKLIVMAPADMPPALGNGAIAGFIVADPFNAVAEVNKVGKIARFTGDVWLNHACCVVLMHEDDTVNRPKWAQGVVTALAKAQVWARENRVEAAKVLSKDGGNYLPQSLPVIERALTYFDPVEYQATRAVTHTDWKNHRIDFQPFPFPSYTEELVRLLKDTAVEGDDAFLKALDPAQAHAKLVDDRFARVAIAAAGGAAKFGIPETLSRTERIAP